MGKLADDMTYPAQRGFSDHTPIELHRHFLDRPHACTRYLYLGQKPGRLTCLVQRHTPGACRPLRLQAFPSALERDKHFKGREDRHVYAATYVLEGEARLAYSDDGERYELRAGSMFQYNGHAMHELRLEPMADFTECSFSLDGGTGAHLSELEIWDSSVRVCRVGLHASVARAYLDLYNAILDHGLSARTLLRQCTQLLEQLYSFARRDDADTLLRNRACALIGSNLSPRFTMQEAARLLDLSYDTFRRRFRALVGMPPIEYQLRCRIEQACLLLQNHSVKETAALLDYSDAFIFSRQFKHFTGVSPSTYQRRSVQQK